jgi:non-specific serine/threonine protein kinase
VFLVDLAPLADPQLVVVQVGRAIGMVDARARRDPEALVDGLCDHLGARAMLLVLDNCEHLVDAVARLSDAVLGRCPEVAVLATSREPLAIGGEILWRVPSLAMPPGDSEMIGTLPGGDAVTLFCERARAVDADFALSADNAAAVARICRRLDGIPLAMELAAARLGVLSADQVADRLDDCFRVLSAGPRTAAARQQTFRATMDWSYQLLPVAEQLLLQRLSVFAGSFDLEAIEGVTADGRDVAAHDVLDLLARLVDKSLVSVRGQGGEARYRVLETVRQYAAEKLAESGEAEGGRRRHRDYYLDIARTYLDGDPFNDAFWLVRFGLSPARPRRWRHPGGVVDPDNLRAALDWSAAQDDAEACLFLATLLAVYSTLGGYFVDGRARLEQALAQSAPSSSRPRMRALNMLGFLVVQQGEMDLSLTLHSEALALAREAADTCEVGVGAFYVGARVLHQGDVARAAQLFGESFECSESLGATDGMAWCEMMLGWVAIAGGDHVAAEGHFEAALDLSRSTAGNLRAHALGGAALLAAEAGDGERAEAMAGEGVEEARRLGLQTILVMTLTRAAEVGILLGRWEWAEKMLVELFTVLHNTGGRSFLADALEMAGLLQEVRGHPDSAAELVGASERVRREANETPDARPVTPLLDACRQRLLVSGMGCRRTRGRGLLPSRDLAGFALRELQTPPAPGGAGQRRIQPGATTAPVLGLLRRTGKRWLVGYGEVRFELPDTKGLGYLARLLAEPDREIHVLDLLGAGRQGDPGHAGAVLDEQAKSAYRRRVRELEEEIEEAGAWNDPERVARAEIELDALTRQLAAGVGLGGRDRLTASAAERARVSVRKAVTAAVARIGEHHSDLALLLGTTVKTGMYCRYTPDPRLPVTWEL